ncbi:DNA (cytosine-5-)-methyltransferase [Staphylococcus gallinarum]|uniref:Cytosine-specific methyltransferase n=2 Tax=Staphylococcus gallinarum TaxID=1293 RepID=A0A3A0GYV0_STAGA|nr:DNA (cytosine-5-)-methyltransferase [Staphylococcus gallinarum]RIL21460.1 DNA (cytosine-5-)-methyltransferase [Staphylococcus gallinarum]RIL27277.1 DNA (cytosine-5-)-methyltransferase [Staphylococcus gallinarum]RIL41625.1 DNA (cytosine-5-)-methyltransferase [Staphylococcus gallinarum]RIO88551.1 DNA (cytosine-5-)-methyltransferase [Staphylococcus gallinarum]
MFKVIETFSGIGSQAQALKNLGLDFSVEAIVEWEIGALFAYDVIHNGPQDLKPFRHHTKESLISALSKYNLSNDGKEALSSRALNSMSMLQLKSILAAIERTNNKVDITNVKASDLPDSDLLTYSFPCQDLSVSGHWHKNEGGINRDANNRSTLLWQIERLLIEYDKSNKELPKFLLMENVSNILSDKHIDNFNEWCAFLENLGYVNQIYTLDARNFGIPQTRIRTYMISVLPEDEKMANDVKAYFETNNLEKVIRPIDEIEDLSKYLRLNYNDKIYRQEAIDSTPTLTPSREKILKLNPALAEDNIPNNEKFARTITTKQDRHPNSGIILYNKEVLTPVNNKYRNLTPRECFLLMGFDELSFDILMENNIKFSNERRMLPNAKLIRLAGNSIVVPVLEAIFKQMIDIKQSILTKSSLAI